jgi:hypothetical protein
MDGFIVFACITALLAAAFVGFIIMKAASSVAVASGYTPF